MKRKKLKGKYLLKIVFLLIIGSVVISIFWEYRYYKNTIYNLETENYELIAKFEDLRSQNEDLESLNRKLIFLLEEANFLRDEAYDLYIETYENYRNLLIKGAYYKENTGYNQRDYNAPYGISNSNHISLEKSISTTYYNGAYIIKPNISNLHLLLSMSQEDFKKKMRENNYSLDTSGDTYIHNDTKDTYCMIDKEWNNVSMIIMSSYHSDIESWFSKNNINYKFERGSKVYRYKLNGESYSMTFINKYNSLALLLEKL